MKRTDSPSKLYRIPLRAITQNTNPRNPLSKTLQKEGWTVFDRGPKDLWLLGTSDDPNDRASYAKVIQEHDPEITALAANILAVSLLQAVEVRDNGTGGGDTNTYRLVYGARRCLAVLYNWCVLGKPAEPVIDAKLTKGNEITLLHRAVSENIRLQPNAIEEAKAIVYAKNAGEPLDEIAKTYGVSVSTVRNRLALLDLPLDVQNRVAAGKLSAAKALRPNGENGEAPAKKRPKVRSPKEVEEVLREYAEDSVIGRLLSWFLCKRKDF